jgi:hypothetical protein
VSTGEHTKVRVRREYAEIFLGELLRLGLKLADVCIDTIADPELRETIKTLLKSTTAGTLIGASLGVTVAGPAGAKAGALIGAGLGLTAGLFAVVVQLRLEPGPLGPELVAEVA